MTVRILHGDCRDVLRTLADASVDSVVTDPPYELGFMGKKWDRTGVANDIRVWAECLRVLKPGGHLAAFGGTRTYHRMVCAIEDAGFEVRDQLGWVYGSGFPKSLDVSKAIDKAAGAERIVTRPATATYKPGTNIDWDSRSSEQREQREQREQPATQEAAAWQGWGTALKPAWEPIVLARKPLVGTVAENVLQHGTGAMNIDGCRVDGVGQSGLKPYIRSTTPEVYALGMAKAGREVTYTDHPAGRWPANIVHDGSEEVVALFPGEAGGSAARFFYCAKADRADRNAGLDGMPEKPLLWSSGEQNPGAFQSPNTTRVAQNNHPTVKPTDLMRWLCRLITPPGGTVLDPFAGSGSTLKAAELEGFSAIGIELNSEYIEIARRRIASDAPLFAEVAA